MTVPILGESYIAHQISLESFRIADGALHIALGLHRLAILRNGPELGYQEPADVVIVDPVVYDYTNPFGIIGLNEGHNLTLGSKHTHGRFKFLSVVSRAHARLSLHDGLMTVEDLGSMHGTYRIAPK